MSKNGEEFEPKILTQMTDDYFVGGLVSRVTSARFASASFTNAAMNSLFQGNVFYIFNQGCLKFRLKFGKLFL